MQIPSARTPTEKCVELGLYAQSMIIKFSDMPALATLSDRLGASTQMLAQAQSAYAELELKRVAARVELRFADYSANRHVRALQRTIEVADGMKKGKIAAAVLPEGISPIVRLVGMAQATELRAIEGRLEAAGSLWEGAVSEKAKVTSERQRYEAALAMRRTITEAADDARARRDAAKEQFLDVYAQVAAQVKAAFPRNRPMQDLFFDEIFDRSSGAGSDEPGNGLVLENRLQS